MCADAASFLGAQMLRRAPLQRPLVKSISSFVGTDERSSRTRSVTRSRLGKFMSLSVKESLSTTRVEHNSLISFHNLGQSLILYQKHSEQLTGPISLRETSEPTAMLDLRYPCPGTGGIPGVLLDLIERRYPDIWNEPRIYRYRILHVTVPRWIRNHVTTAKFLIFPRCTFQREECSFT